MSKKFVVWTKGPLGPWEPIDEKLLSERQAEKIQKELLQGSAQIQVQVVEEGKQPWEGEP